MMSYQRMASANKVKLTPRNDRFNLNISSTDIDILPNFCFNVSTTAFYFNKCVSVDYS